MLCDVCGKPWTGNHINMVCQALAPTCSGGGCDGSGVVTIPSMLGYGFEDAFCLCEAGVAAKLERMDPQEMIEAMLNAGKITTDDAIDLQNYGEPQIRSEYAHAFGAK